MAFTIGGKATTTAKLFRRRIRPLGSGSRLEELVHAGEYQLVDVVDLVSGTSDLEAVTGSLAQKCPCDRGIARDTHEGLTLAFELVG